MATRGEMVSMLADIFGLPVTAVDVADRALSEAGLRTKSSRGRSATQMSGDDVVSVAIALAGNWGVKAAASMVAQLVALILSDGRMEPIADNDDDNRDKEPAVAVIKSLTKKEILSAPLLVPYPRNILQMKESFGASFAEILQVLNSENASKFRATTVTMIPDFPGASIEFAYRSHWFTIRFGNGIDDVLSDNLDHCEGYTKIVLRHRRLVRLAEILKA